MTKGRRCEKKGEPCESRRRGKAAKWNETEGWKSEIEKAKNAQRTGKKRKVNTGRGLYMYKWRVTEERPSVTMKRDGLKTWNEERSVYDRAKGRVGGKEALEGVRKLENSKVEGGGLERRWKRGWKVGRGRERRGKRGTAGGERGRKEGKRGRVGDAVSVPTLETRESSRARPDHLFMRSEMIARLLCAVSRAGRVSVCVAARRWIKMSDRLPMERDLGASFRLENGPTKKWTLLFKEPGFSFRCSSNPKRERVFF